MLKKTFLFILAISALSMSACLGQIDNKRLEQVADSLKTAGIPDSLATMGARALLMDAKDFADTQAQIIIDDLANGAITGEKAAILMNDINAVARQVGRDDTAAEFFAALDRLAADLPLDRQMLVYTRATTPEALGSALGKELKTGTDRDLVNRQIAAARNIYTGKDLDDFNAALQK